jgi:hypothetical protein
MPKVVTVASFFSLDTETIFGRFARLRLVSLETYIARSEGQIFLDRYIACHEGFQPVCIQTETLGSSTLLARHVWYSNRSKAILHFPGCVFSRGRLLVTPGRRPTRYADPEPAEFCTPCCLYNAIFDSSSLARNVCYRLRQTYRYLHRWPCCSRGAEGTSTSTFRTVYAITHCNALSRTAYRVLYAARERRNDDRDDR